MTQPKYTAAEKASNVIVVLASVMRGGQLTDRQKARLDRNAENARDRATTN